MACRTFVRRCALHSLPRSTPLRPVTPLVLERSAATAAAVLQTSNLPPEQRHAIDVS